MLQRDDVILTPHLGASSEEAQRNVAIEIAQQICDFLLEGVANAPNAEAMFQPDRIHPLAQAHPTMLQNVWPALRKLLR